MHSRSVTAIRPVPVPGATPRNHTLKFTSPCTAVNGGNRIFWSPTSGCRLLRVWIISGQRPDQKRKLSGCIYFGVPVNGTLGLALGVVKDDIDNPARALYRGQFGQDVLQNK